MDYTMAVEEIQRAAAWSAWWSKSDLLRDTAESIAERDIREAQEQFGYVLD